MARARSPSASNSKISFVQRLRPYPHGTRTGNVGSSARKAQAAFDAGLRFAEGFDFGIDQDKGHMGSDLNRIASDAKNARPVFDLSDVDNAELNGHANLLGRQTDSVRVVHRFQHILNECTDPGVYFVDPFSLGPQRGMAVLHDFKKHGVHYGATRRLINFNELLFLFLGLGESRDILDACISQGVQRPDNHAKRGFAICLHGDRPGRRLLAQGSERVRKVLERDGLFVQGDLGGALDAQYRGLRDFPPEPARPFGIQED